jgi:hypothetical protein
MTAENIAAITELSEIILAVNESVDRHDLHSFGKYHAAFAWMLSGGLSIG